MLQTDTQVPTSNMAMLISTLFMLPFPEANHYAAYITVLSVCVCQLQDCHDIWCHTFEGYQNTILFSSIRLVTTTWRTREFVKQ